MEIKELYLKNFRNIEEGSYQFDPNFTAIIGMNGAGKSSVLSALKIAIGSYFLGVKISSLKAPSIEQKDVRQTRSPQVGHTQHYDVVVRATAKLDGAEQLISWQRRLVEGSNSTTYSNEDVGEIRSISQAKYQAITKKQQAVTLPLLAYFGTDRVYGAARNRNNSKDGLKRLIFQQGYHNWSNLRLAAYQYTNWLAYHPALVENQLFTAESKALLLETVQRACPYIEDLQFIRDEFFFRSNLRGKLSDLMPLSLKSDGLITYVNMVAELAYRCIVLNAHKGADAIKSTKGVILIDELDLHLHPSWQKHVVQDLKNAFPGLQFIVTTHSPVLIQSLEDNELINLEDGSEAIIGLEEDPFRYSVEEVLSREMGVKDVQRSQQFKEMEAAATAFFKLAQQKDNPEAIAEAKKKYQELSKRYSKDPAYVALLAAKLNL